MINNPKNHIFHPFDVELNSLHDMLKDMAEFLTQELTQTIQALAQNNTQYLQDSIELIKGVEQLESKIDAEILSIIVRFTPVANDLRNVLATSKIAAQFEEIGYEIADFIFFLISSVDTSTEPLSPELISDSSGILKHLLALLDNIKSVIETNEIDQLRKMIETSGEYEKEANYKLQNALIAAAQSPVNHNQVIQILRVIKLLQFCSSQIKRISAHINALVLSDHRFRDKSSSSGQRSSL